VPRACRTRLKTREWAGEAALRRPFPRRSRPEGHQPRDSEPTVRTPRGIEASPTLAPVEIAPNDPLLVYLRSASGAVEIETLELDSPALAELKAGGVKLIVPLVSQGERLGGTAGLG